MKFSAKVGTSSPVSRIVYSLQRNDILQHLQLPKCEVCSSLCQCLACCTSVAVITYSPYSIMRLNGYNGFRANVICEPIPQPCQQHFHNFGYADSGTSKPQHSQTTCFNHALSKTSAAQGTAQASRLEQQHCTLLSVVIIALLC